MKPAVVRLIDLGMDEGFATSMTVTQAAIGSLNVGRDGRTAAEIECVHTRDWHTVAEALRAPTAVVQVIAHGIDAPEDVSFFSHDEETVVALHELADHFVIDGVGVAAAAILADT